MQITYMQKEFIKTLKQKNFGEYQDLYLKSDALLLTNVFKKFRKICLRIYHLDPAKFLPAPGLAWQAALRKTEVKLELLTYIHIAINDSF